MCSSKQTINGDTAKAGLIWCKLEFFSIKSRFQNLFFNVNSKQQFYRHKCCFKLLSFIKFTFMWKFFVLVHYNLYYTKVEYFIVLKTKKTLIKNWYSLTIDYSIRILFFRGLLKVLKSMFFFFFFSVTD